MFAGGVACHHGAALYPGVDAASADVAAAVVGASVEPEVLVVDAAPAALDAAAVVAVPDVPAAGADVAV